MKYLLLLVFSTFTLLFSHNNLSHLNSKADSLKILMRENFLPSKDGIILERIKKNKLLTLWQEYKIYFDFLYSLDSKNKTIELIYYDMGFYLIHLIGFNEQYNSFLNKKTPLLPKQSFLDLKKKILRKKYYSKKIDRNMEPKLYKKFKEKSNNLAKLVKKYQQIYYVSNFYYSKVQRQDKIIYPLKKYIMPPLARIRFSTRKGGLITPEQCVEISQVLQPGDILVERKNWYLSNFALSGFWGHSVLYLGTALELTKWSQDINHIYIKRGYKSFIDYIKNKYPIAYKEYSKQGNQVIETLAEGTLFFSLDNSVGISDCLGAIRVVLPKEKIALAIEKAFSYYGREYDFEFDFYSDDRLVCSELILNCYSPLGIEFTLEKVRNHTALSSNMIVKQFKDNKLLEFVTFYDALDDENRVIKSTEQDFIASAFRPDWSYENNVRYPKQFINDIEKNYIILPLSLNFLFGIGTNTLFRDNEKVINFFGIGIPFSSSEVFFGVDFALFWSSYIEKIYGLQLSGLINSSIYGGFGSQVAFLSNLIATDFWGLQISGIYNLVGRKFVGIQMSSYQNQTDQLRGVQIGSFNKSSHNQGVQIGIVNSCQINSSIQIGLLNLVKETNNGLNLGLINYQNYLTFDLGSNIKLEPSLAIISGIKKLITELDIGLSEKKLSYGLSYGYRLNKKKIELQPFIGVNYTKKIDLSIGIKILLQTKLLKFYVKPNYHKKFDMNFGVEI